MNTVILIAGLPASGKSTFATHLGKELGLPMLSKDRIKELLFDSLGFRSREEKVALSIAGTGLLYYYAESLMQTKQDFILETNFETVHKPGLLRLLETYSYRSLTVRFGGDYEAVYRRYVEREQSEERHAGHKTSKAYPPPDETAPLLGPSLSFEEFVRGVQTRGIHDFSIGGDEIAVDATCFENVRTEEIILKVRAFLGEAPK